MVEQTLKNITGFFDVKYQTPRWLINKFSRRNLLKSAAGMTAISSLPIAFSATAFTKNTQQQLLTTLQTDPWLTLNAVLDHLLPKSSSGPSAKELQVLTYLYKVVHQQPTEKNEIDFIYKGVGWLNGFAKNQLQKSFVELTKAEKETILRGISRSSAGENWLNNLLGYIFEAMLSSPVYGGNPQGMGWQWLEHQPGFPLPKKGERYFELPKRSVTRGISARTIIESKDLLARSQLAVNKGSNKA
jgi:gluconate 2-dehydrogenase gamma chain